MALGEMICGLAGMGKGFSWLVKLAAEVQIVVTALGLPVGTMMFLKSAMKSKSKDSKEE